MTGLAGGDVTVLSYFRFFADLRERMGVEVCGIPLAAPAFQLNPAQLEAAILQQRQRGRTGAGLIPGVEAACTGFLVTERKNLLSPVSSVMPLSLKQSRPSARVSLLQPPQPAGQRHQQGDHTPADAGLQIQQSKLS